MFKALASGFAGAVAVTVVHETVRRFLPHAPRVDVIGTRALRRPIEALGYEPPPWDRLHRYALGGDLLANSLYFSLVAAGSPEGAMARGLVLGAAAGVGAALLPPVMGLGKQPHRLSPMTELLTVAYYTLGGVVAAETARALEGE
jgi:hypothetical protein